MKNRSDCLKEYGSDYRIQQEITDGKLFKVGRGVYSKDKSTPEIAVLAYQYPKAVITMRIAFYIQGLTDVIPEEYDLSTDRNASKIKAERVKQYFAPSVFLSKE